jgi:LacI family transcriptional regulator
MVGYEKKWLDLLSLQVPDDIGLACLAKPTRTAYAGIDEYGEAIGATAVELVAAQIYRNEFGPPSIPKTTMIEGHWTAGATIKNRK